MYAYYHIIIRIIILYVCVLSYYHTYYHTYVYVLSYYHTYYHTYVCDISHVQNQYWLNVAFGLPFGQQKIVRFDSRLGNNSEIFFWVGVKKFQVYSTLYILPPWKQGHCSIATQSLPSSNVPFGHWHPGWQPEGLHWLSGISHVLTHAQVTFVHCSVGAWKIKRWYNNNIK